MFKDKVTFLRYYIPYVIRVLWHAKITKTRRIIPDFYAGKSVIDGQECNDYIREKIISKSPFMAGRFGATELGPMIQSELVRLGFQKQLKENKVEHICTVSGFFPGTQEAARKFSDLMFELSNQVDLLAISSLIMEDYVIKTYASQTRLCRLEGIEPYCYKRPWSMALAGKKVLVIHPFEKTILRQYEKRRFLFQDSDVLPEFELKTVKAIQTIAGEKSEFLSWFDALDYMFDKAMVNDFDIAIVGCGAYGFPLSAKIKKSGKQVVHMGGATQLLFGIMGSRWDTDPFISKLYNEYWVRPDQSETPKNADVVENGCYW